MATNNSVFTNTRTIEQVKSENNGMAFAVIPSKNSNHCFFACGELRGYVAQNVADALKAKQPTGTLVVSHVESDGFSGEMLHEQSTSNAIAVF